MGCHTWFNRPLTKEERELLRSTAYARINRYTTLSESLIKELKYSIDNDTDFWLEGNWFNSDEFIIKIKGKFYVDCASLAGDQTSLLNIPKHFHDVFRVKNYPSWIIHNCRELRKKMKKKYFDLTKEQLDDIKDFFNTYKGGVITFG